MKSVIALIAVLGMTSTTFAAGVSIEKIAKQIKEANTRTVIKVVTNDGSEPCSPEGESYVVEIQVRETNWDGINSKVIYTWNTKKSVSVDKDGNQMEVCAE